MSGIKDEIIFEDDFLAGAIGTAAASGTPWMIDDTSSSGTPTYDFQSAHGGQFAMEFAATAEVENVCLHFGDKLVFDIDLLGSVEFAIKTEATLDSATTIVAGLGSARNDTPDSVAANAWFRLEGSNSVVVETDDGVTDNDDVATGKTLGAAFKEFKISFEAGTADVRFFIDGDRVASGTTFDMSGYTGLLQPIFQLQKTSDTNTDALTIDFIRVYGKRAQ